MKYVVALTAALVMTVAYAAPRCVKGIPCGNSCISADKVCHIGQPPSVLPITTPPPVTTPSAPPAGNTWDPFETRGTGVYDFDKKVGIIAIPCGLPVEFTIWPNKTGEYLKFNTLSNADDMLLSVKVDGILKYMTSLQGQSQVGVFTLQQNIPITFEAKLLGKNKSCPAQLELHDIELTSYPTR